MTTKDDLTHAADDALFMELIAMFQVAAMQQLGKLPNPVTNKVERNLDQARATIDFVEMIKRKTEGNRTSAENELLGKVLFELQMNYVDEVSRAGKGGGGADAEEGEADETGGRGGDEERPETPGNSEE